MTAGIGPDRDQLAAEYVLGVLDSEERREAEHLAESDREFQLAVSQWQSRFAEIDETTLPEPPSEELWTRIESDLSQQAPSVGSKSATVASARPFFASVWDSLSFWRVAGLAGALTSVVLALAVGMLATRVARGPILIAVLLTDENRPAAVVNAFANGSAELIPLADLQIPPGRALEVWAILGANQNPISIGVVNQPRSLGLDLQRIPGLRADQVIAVSVEPPQGSPTGQPTGPVIMKGSTSTAL